MNGSNSISPFTDVDMELAAVNEDDSEPAKELSAGGTVDYEECALQERFDQLSLSEGQFTIVIGGHELVCEEALLVGGCKYFEALIHFEDSRRIHFKGGVNFKTLKAIVNFLSTKSLEIDLENWGNLLRSVPFLMAGHLNIKIVQTLGTPFFNTNPKNGCPKMICQYSGRAPRHFICCFHHMSCSTDVRP